jgi:fused signal recognition particle receptor
MGLFKKLFGGLAKTAGNITQSISAIFTKDLGEEFYDDLTAVLLSADMGAEAAEQIIEDIRATAKKQGIKTEEALKEALADSIASILQGGDPLDPKTSCAQNGLVILIAGVNGVGKTTSIGKLAGYYKAQKKSVLIVAADTFRAAATEQLDTWATRVGVRIVKQTQGADPAAIVFDALTSAKAKNDDIVIIDTAGRLHNKDNLMNELSKIDRVVKKNLASWDNAPEYKKYIVLDATTGQNAINQVDVFNEACGGLDGIILTKLDGTAKGGVVVAIKQKFNIPVVFVGVGEKADDLLPFYAKEFSRAIVGLST